MSDVMGQPKTPDLWDMGPSHRHHKDSPSESSRQQASDHRQQTSDHRQQTSDHRQQTSNSSDSLYSKQRSTEKLYSLCETKPKSPDKVHNRSADKLFSNNNRSRSIETLDKSGSSSSQTDYPGFDEEGNITFIGNDGKVLDISENIASTPSRPPNQPGCCVDGGAALSVMYCIVLVLVCVSVTAGEVLTNTWLTRYSTVAFMLYLYALSVWFLLGLEIFLVRDTRRRRQPKSPGDTLERAAPYAINGGFSADAMTNGQSFTGQGYSTFSSVGSMDMYIVTNTDPPQPSSRHWLSLPLRIGTTVFGVGFLVYEGLLLKEFHDEHTAVTCGLHSKYWIHYALLAFIAIQTYFVFKHPQVTVSSWQSFARFGYMHVFATNICVWIRTISRQTLEEYIRDQWFAISNNTTAQPAESSSRCGIGGGEVVGVYGAQPYLYPCILQYSILCAAAMAAFHGNLQPRTPPPHRREALAPPRPYPTTLLEINFYRSHKGLLAGLVVFAAMCVSVILSYSYFGDSSQDKGQSRLIFLITDLALQAILIITSLINWFQVRTLSYIPGRPLHMDSATLYTAFIMSFLFLLLRVLPLLTAISNGFTDLETVLGGCSALLACVVSIVQTSFLVEAFRREAVSRWVKKQLPGRGTALFLLIVNLTVWALRTVYVSEVSGISSKVHQLTYTRTLWTFLVQTLWPWLLLYHFQAVVCLSYIWTSVYRPQMVTRLSRQPSKSPPTSVETAEMGTQVKVVELKRRVKDQQNPDGEMKSVLSPVSEV